MWWNKKTLSNNIQTILKTFSEVKKLLDSENNKQLRIKN